MNSTKQSLGRPKGAATTEKLVVLLLGFMIIVPALVVFGPILTEKMALVNEMLGGTAPTDTLANRTPEAPASNALLYVLGFGGVTGVFFITFVAPLLFPRARRTRQEIINDLAEKFEFLQPLADPDLGREHELAQMRGVADELRSMEAHKESALQIESQDYANMAMPDEQTISRDALDAPRPAWSSARHPDGVGAPDATDAPPSLSLGGGFLDDDATVDLEDGPMQRVVAPSEDETMVASRVSTSPADASLMTSIPADQFPGRRVNNPNEAVDAPDSGHFASAPETGAHRAEGPRTQRRGKIEAMPDAHNYEPDAETLARPALDRSLLNRDVPVEKSHELDPLDPTLMGNQRAADDPDATTRPHTAFHHED